MPAHALQIERLEHVQHLDERDAARRRRRHRDDLVAAIHRAQRLADGRLVFLQVFECEDAAARLHLGDDELRRLAFVEVARVRLDPLQRGGELGLHELLADLVVLAVALEDATALRERPEPLDRAFAAQAAREVLIHGEAFCCEQARRLDELGPRQLAVAFVREHESGDRARHADGFVALRRCALDHVAGGVEVHVARRRQRRALAIVDRFGGSIRFADEHESRRRRGCRRRAR